VWHDPEVEEHGPRGKTHIFRRIAFAFNDRFERVADRYPNALKWSLAHRAIVLGAAGVSIVTAFMIIPALGFTWMPEVNADEFNISVRTAPASRMEYTVQKGLQIAEIARQDEDVLYTYTSVGGGFRGTSNSGSVFVKLKAKHDRARSMFDIQDDLRGKYASIPGARASIQGTRSIFGGYRQPISINVQGPEPTRLKIAANEVMEAIRQVPGIAETQSSDEGEIPQLDVSVNRQEAWAAGVGVGAIASTLQPLFSGFRATQWEDALGYSHDVVVVYPDSMRASAADVESIPVLSSNTSGTSTPMIPLSQVADVRAGVGPQQIERRMLERMISISAQILPGFTAGDVAADAEEAIKEVGLPPGYRTVFGGDVQNMNETKGFVLEALLLAVVFIYLILASLFGSFLQPLAIMIALPLSFIGVALALLVTNGNLNVMSMIGIIMLMGLVTKNGILLVDFTNQQRAAGIERAQALLQAGRIRLRPIIMTTIAMIFGMLPMAFAIGEGAEQRAPMARAVIGGLITSTLLTLFVVPVVYSMLDDLAGLRARRKVAVPARELEPVGAD
jgi:HAE1 family hydrophobic/amphiphilic exporter-1